MKLRKGCTNNWRKQYKKEWDNETLLEYYAVLFFNLQEGKDVNDEWMNVKKEILQRMETNIYSTAMSALSHSVSLMEAQKDKDMIRASFHNILGKVDILHICGIISDEEKQFWEDRVYKAYGFE